MDFSHTRIQTFYECPRKYLHHYLRRIRMRKRPNYFVLGSAVHKFIEIWYRTKDIKMAERAVDNEFAAVDRSTLNREEIHSLEVDKQIAMGIARAYPITYKEDFDEFDKFLTEQEFKFPMTALKLDGETHSYGGFIDVLVQDHAGDWWILETKTYSPQSVNPDLFEKVKIDSQVCGYMYGARHILGKFPAGIIYNVIKKPGIRLRKGESLAAYQQRVYLEYTKLAQEKNYFSRQPLRVPTARLREWEVDVQRTAHQIANLIANKSEHWPMNTGACQAKFGSCQFMPACTSRTYNKLLYVKDKR